MADIPIITRESIRAKARAAFAAGHTINDHCMNHDANALPDWQAEFTRCEAEAALVKASDRETV